MDSFTAFVAPQKIKHGDVIAVNGTPSNKIGFVYKIMRDSGGHVTGFKYLPVYVYDEYRNRPADKDFWVLNQNDLAKAKLNPSKQYRLEFRVEDFHVSEDSILRYGTAHGTLFSQKVTHTMDGRIHRAAELARNEAAAAEAENRAFVFHKSEPTHVRARRKAGTVLTPDITIDDAVQVGLIPLTAHNILKAAEREGAFKNQRTPLMLSQMFDLASSKHEDEKHQKFHGAAVKGAYAATVTLREAFADGYLNESVSFNQLRDMGINQLGDASHMALRLSLWNPPRDHAHDKIDNNDIILQPLNQLRRDILAAWPQFMGQVAADKSVYESQGITCLYPR
jgi:hypothetical protein